MRRSDCRPIRAAYTVAGRPSVRGLMTQRISLDPTQAPWENGGRSERRGRLRTSVYRGVVPVRRLRSPAPESCPNARTDIHEGGAAGLDVDVHGSDDPLVEQAGGPDRDIALRQIQKACGSSSRSCSPLGLEGHPAGKTRTGRGRWSARSRSPAYVGRRSRSAHHDQVSRPRPPTVSVHAEPAREPLEGLIGDKGDGIRGSRLTGDQTGPG